ncbi:MAG: two-component system, OmpR family, sensor kinase [Solirubrobacteraceae bacterium]|nr:two-component system, OmpR family, sensor kinase [Solirubrobacteraceae bacterium]
MRSLRGRVFAYLGLAVAVSTLLTVVVAGVLIHARVETQARRTLDRQADALASAVTGSQTRVFRVANGRPRTLPRAGARARALLAAVPPSGNASGRATIRGQDVFYAARETPGGGRIVLLRSARLAGTDWNPFLTSILVAGAGGALVAALLSLFLARRLARPLRKLSAATERVAAGEAPVPVPVEGEDELAHLTAAFNAMAEDLAAARDAERAFLMSVSHELKTPLTAVRGYAEGLGDGAIEPAEGAAVIGMEAARLERLVGDLLDLARLDRHAFSVGRDPVDLRDTVAAARDVFAPRAAELGVELGLEAPAPSWVAGDRDRLAQVVSNLVENALRVTPAGGRVTLVVEPGALSVRDSGPGLAQEDLPHAFDRFYLHERYASDRAVGSGLGLAIVKELVGAMGGRVSVASAPGEGATFTVQLPVTAAAAPSR